MQKEELFDQLCMASIDLDEIYEKQLEALTTQGMPPAVLEMYDAERQMVQAELNKRIQAVSAEMFG